MTIAISIIIIYRKYHRTFLCPQATGFIYGEIKAAAPARLINGQTRLEPPGTVYVYMGSFVFFELIL